MVNRYSLACYGLFMQFPHSTRPAVDDVSLVMSPESVNVVVGASGSGKSTLLMCLAGLEVPTKGRVVHGDVDVYGLDDRQRAAWRLRTIGLVFQNSELVPELTLRDNIALPLELLGTGRRDALRRADRLAEILTSVRAVSDGLAKCQEARHSVLPWGVPSRTVRRSFWPMNLLEPWTLRTAMP